MSILVRNATAISIKAPGDLNGYTDLSFVRRVCRIRASDITSFYLRYFQDAFQAHHKACGSTDYYFIQKAFKRGGMQISSLPPSLGNSAPINMDEYASRSAPPTYIFYFPWFASSAHQDGSATQSSASRFLPNSNMSACSLLLYNKQRDK